MKRIITTSALALTVVAGAFSQSAQIKIKAREAEIPVDVVESFKKDYKGTDAVEWAIVPAVIVGEEYVVSGYDNLNGEKPTSYEVTLKGDDIRAKAVYDKNGVLRYSKEVITHTALPDAVRNAVFKKYPGYTILKDQEIINQGKFNLIHYRVVLEKGTEKVTLAVNDSGKILKEIKQSHKAKHT